MSMRVLDIPLYLHMGLPKCASSAIQEVLTQKDLPHYVGKLPHDDANQIFNPYQTPDIAHFFREKVLYTPELLWDQAAMLAEAKMLFAQQRAQNQALLVSDEGLSGFGFSNYRRKATPDMLGILKRLKSLFKQVKVLVIFREQQRFLRSYYNQLIHMGYNIAFPYFVENLLTREYDVRQSFYLDKLIPQIQSARIDITLIPFEALKQDPIEAYRVLSTFFEEPFTALPYRNPSPDFKTLQHTFMANLKTPRSLGLFTPMHDAQKTKDWVTRHDTACESIFYHIMPPIEEQFLGLIARQNTALNQLLNWELEKYGYILGENPNKHINDVI